MAKTNRTIAELKALSYTEVSFLYFWLRKTEREEREWWEKCLGVSWNVGDVKSRFDSIGTETQTFKDDDNISVPLALGINADLLRGLYKMITGKDPVSGEGHGKDHLKSTKDKYAEKGLEVEPMSREMMLASVNALVAGG
jgi:hypothetical protein